MRFASVFDECRDLLKEAVRQGQLSKEIPYTLISKKMAETAFVLSGGDSGANAKKKRMRPSRLTEFVNGKDISVSELCGIYNALESVASELGETKARALIPAFYELETCLETQQCAPQASPEGFENDAFEGLMSDIAGTKFIRLLKHKKRRGDPTDFERLSGTYFVLRRDISGEVLSTSLEVSYDLDTNACTWRNAHLHDGHVTYIDGLVTEKVGNFFFFGFLNGSALLHCMSFKQPLGVEEWNEYSALVLTYEESAIASRAAVIRTDMTFAETEKHLGVLTMEAAAALNLHDEQLLDNSCDATGVLRPLVRRSKITPFGDDI